MAHVINVVVMVSTVVAWFTAIRLAYITNRIWVFHSQASTSKEIFKETSAFFM
nr:GtrA family protein [uncultured Acetatifactor sp.]